MLFRSVKVVNGKVKILAGKIKNGDHVDVKVVNGKVKISVREEG